MVKNPDIVAGVAALKSHRPYVVGFAAETNYVEEYARQKRARKNLDLICANDVSQPNQGFNSDSNALHLFWQDGEKRLPLERKELLGQLLLDEIVTRYDEKKSTLRFWTRVSASNFRCRPMPPPAPPDLTCEPVSTTP